MTSRVARVGAVAVVGWSLAVAGCDMMKGKGEDESAATAAPAPTAAPADTGTAEAESGGTSGIAECDQFLEKYRCLLRNRNESESAADEMADEWKRASNSATGRSTASNACRAKARAMQSDFVRAGCETPVTTETCVACSDDPMARGCCGVPKSCSSDGACGHGVCCLDPGGQVAYCFTRRSSCPGGWSHFQSLGKEGQSCRPGSSCDAGLKCDSHGKCVRNIRRIPIVR